MLFSSRAKILWAHASHATHAKVLKIHATHTIHAKTSTYATIL